MFNVGLLTCDSVQQLVVLDATYNNALIDEYIMDAAVAAAAAAGAVYSRSGSSSPLTTLRSFLMIDGSRIAHQLLHMEVRVGS